MHSAERHNNDLHVGFDAADEAEHLLAVQVSREPEPITQSYGSFIIPDLPDSEKLQDYMHQKSGVGAEQGES